MRRWFLSYHSPDQALAERVKQALEQRDAGCRVFFAPTHLRAGGFWSAQLAAEIAEATAFILLIGEKGIGPWQVLEYDEALDRRVKSPDFPIIPLLLKGQQAPGLPFLRRLHWIISADPSSEADLARLMDAASSSTSPSGGLWRYTSPYRGLAAMAEKDADYFFGRDLKTVEVLSALATEAGRLPMLLGNSGVGKSSLAQAGVLAALKRQAWPERAGVTAPWPSRLDDSRCWCFLTMRPGTEPIQALVESFLDTWQLGAVDPILTKHQNGWIKLLREGNANLRDLIGATERRYKELDQPSPPAFFLYIDQGEELYVRAAETERRGFSTLLATGLADRRLIALMSIRADFLGELHTDEALYGVCHKLDVPPLREAELREVVSQPAALLSALFETKGLATDIARRTAEDSTTDAGALPLLSYLLDDMWSAMVKRDDGILRLPAQAIELGRVLVDRADAFLSNHPKSEQALRRIFTLKLATVRDDGEPIRRRAFRSEFSDQEWRLVAELANHPNRLLVTATPQTGESYAEVAHEAIFRRWNKLRDWITVEREFLAWRNGLEASRRIWEGTPQDSKRDALLMGLALAQAEKWCSERPKELQSIDKDFIDASVRARKSHARQLNALVAALWALVLIVAGGLAWANQDYLKSRLAILTDILWPQTLTVESEQRLHPGEIFKECADCPEMVAVPGGDFTMGSPDSEDGHTGAESPRHRVAIARSFAVSRFEVTFDEWDACIAQGGCAHPPGDQGWGRGRRPVINISWDDIQGYLAWISRKTGKSYRLLSEAEWEYAARAGTDTAYSWGDAVGRGHANCDGCGSQWDNKRTAPVGSFAANGFGLFDMHGNVWEWVQDCPSNSYDEAPQDGTAQTRPNCSYRILRGGAWGSNPRNVRSADRFGYASPHIRSSTYGFRVGRTLAP
jgi:formylglycine-generating enzyme required for sulfatase activity